MFIGLGIPDSLFGAAWPAICIDFNLPVHGANFVTMIISGGTIISSLLPAKLIDCIGTEVVTAVSTAMTGLVLSQSVMGVQMVFSNVGIMLVPAVFGIIAQNINTDIFPYYLLVLWGIMIIGSFLLNKKCKLESGAK